MADPEVKRKYTEDWIDRVSPKERDRRRGSRRPERPNPLETSELDQEYYQEEYHRRRQPYSHSSNRYYDAYYSHKPTSHPMYPEPYSGYREQPYHSAPPPHQNGKNYYQSQQQSTNYEGFYFKPRREKLNWRIVAAIDVEKLIEDVDIETLESITRNITFSRIDYHDMRYFTEENFVQMFRISQLIIEYLLYVQNYLDSKKKSMEQDVQVILSDLDKCRNLLNQKDDEITYLKRDLKRKKKLNYAYQVVTGANPEKVKMMLQGMKAGINPDFNFMYDARPVRTDPVKSPTPPPNPVVIHAPPPQQPIIRESLITRKIQEEMRKQEKVQRASILKAIENKLSDFKSSFNLDQSSRSREETFELGQKLQGLERVLRLIQDRLQYLPTEDVQPEPIRTVPRVVEPKRVEKVEPRKIQVVGQRQQPREEEPHKVEPRKVEPRKVEPRKIQVVGQKQPPVQQEQKQQPPTPKRIETPPKKVEPRKIQVSKITTPAQPKYVPEVVKPEPEEESEDEFSEHEPEEEEPQQFEEEEQPVNNTVLDDSDYIHPDMDTNLVLDTYDPDQIYIPDASKDYIRSNFFYRRENLEYERELNEDIIYNNLTALEIDLNSSGIDQKNYERIMEVIQHERIVDSEFDDLVNVLRQEMETIANKIVKGPSPREPDVSTKGSKARVEQPKIEKQSSVKQVKAVKSEPQKPEHRVERSERTERTRRNEKPQTPERPVRKESVIEAQHVEEGMPEEDEGSSEYTYETVSDEEADSEPETLPEKWNVRQEPVKPEPPVSSVQSFKDGLSSRSITPREKIKPAKVQVYTYSDDEEEKEPAEPNRKSMESTRDLDEHVEEEEEEDEDFEEQMQKMQQQYLKENPVRKQTPPPAKRTVTVQQKAPPAVTESEDSLSAMVKDVQETVFTSNDSLKFDLKEFKEDDDLEDSGLDDLEDIEI